jgi:2-oxoisovalerate dehydrogenase E2 component (dihydrolipoyl transacylase)
MARFTFKLPDIGEGISEAEIVAWHVAVGDRVEEDQQLADMMTDKATVEMESPVSGTVVELAGEVGDQVSIGAALVVIETDAAESGETEAVAQPADETGSDLSPMKAEAEAASASPATNEATLEAENPGVEEAQEALSPQGRGRTRLHAPSSRPPRSAPARAISASTSPR